ncbi:MAG: AGE family epimerase/isomerase [Sedimentisphaeraceae bacterium JB056]
MELLNLDILKKNQVTDLYNKILVSMMEFIVSRYEADPSYGWVDTKISLITGEDFAADDFLRGRNTVYAWIQGRALEAMTLHADWFEQNSIELDLVARIKDVLHELLSKLEYSRSINCGHLSFFMNKDGRAFRLSSDCQPEYFTDMACQNYNLSDLFCSKGMYVAAKYLGFGKSERDAKDYCLDVIDAVWDGNFVSDQVSFRGEISSCGRILNSIGPYMLSLDTAELLLKDDPEYASDLAGKIIDRILTYHVNLRGEWGFGHQFDCVENIDSSYAPLTANKTVESDPGHSIEFCGLTMRFINNFKKFAMLPEDISRFDDYEDIIKSVFKKNFTNGYVEIPGGICKGYDLVSRNIIDSDMPWWNLPEAMRAALCCASTGSFKEVEEFRDIFNKCHNSFVNNYIRPEYNYISIQTIGADGMVKDTIPATPDIDPGYHTGICLIDCLKVLEEIDLEIA